MEGQRGSEPRGFPPGHRQLMAHPPRKVSTLGLLKASSPPDGARLELLANPKFFLEDGALYYQGRGKYQKILYTPEERRRAFEEAHVISEHKHHGIRATGVNITKSYYWPRITLQARQWVKECEKCQKDRLAELEAREVKVKAKKLKVEELVVPEKKSPSEPKKKQLLVPRLKKEPSSLAKMELLPASPVASKKTAPVAQARGLFHLVGLQLVGPMKQTQRGARFIFVVVDYFTQWVEAAPMNTCSPEETAEQILKLVHRFGFPERIVCARGSEFIRQLNQILRTETNILCDLVVDYQPQTRGLLKKTNSFVEKLLKMVVKKDTVNWDLQLLEILSLQKRVENESEELNLSSEEACSEDSQEEGFSDSDESLPSAPFPRDPSELSPTEEPEILTVLGSCLYCNQLSDKGNDDTFIMMQCDQCQAWVHQLCVIQHHRDQSWRTKFQCRVCVQSHQP